MPSPLTLPVRYTRHQPPVGSPLRQRSVQGQSVVGLWTMSEGAGPAAHDAANRNPATLQGGATWGPGDTGRALVFTGASGCNAVLARLPTTRRSNVYLQARVFLADTARTGMFVKVGGSSDGYGLGVGNGTADSAGNHLVVLYEAVAWYDSGVAIGTGWHTVGLHVSNNNSDPRLYLDGALVGQLGMNFAVAPTTQATIGGYTSGGTPRYFAGSIADVLIMETQPLLYLPVSAPRSLYLFPYQMF